MASPLACPCVCPVGAALNIFGEALVAALIVRDLPLSAPLLQLLASLGGIGTDILAARLRYLQGGWCAGLPEEASAA